MGYEFTKKQKKALAKHKRKTRIKEVQFFALLMGYWLLHILVLGWFKYLFCSRTYIIRAGDILKDVEGRGPNNPWWNTHEVAAASEAAMYNDEHAIIRFTWRTHPFFLDNEFMYVYSKNYKVRVWDHRKKIYLIR